ncbi:MAG: branched-chain amino acid ABC transporter permease, partial [Halobacteria archaeon]|nr:branched-chain amino acid ABC transporter permease [Halobacteria archaeon]
SLTMVGAYLGGLLMVVLISEGTPGILALIFFFIGVVVVFALLTALGSVLELTIVKPLYDRRPLYQILLTFGLAFVINDLMTIIVSIFGLEPITPWQDVFGTVPGLLSTTYTVGGLGIRGLAVFEIMFGVVVVAAIWWFLNRTRWGLYIRAGTEDVEMTEALGINVPRTFTIVFGIGIGLAGVAGMLLMWDRAGILGNSGGASILLSSRVLLPAFVVVIVGGLGTFEGTVVAGLLIGMVDSVMSWLFIEGIVPFAALPEIMIFLILIAVLAVRPLGLFGREEVGRY